MVKTGGMVIQKWRDLGETRGMACINGVVGWFEGRRSMWLSWRQGRDQDMWGLPGHEDDYRCFSSL